MDVELLPEAEFHAGGMKFVEQDVHHPGGYERHPTNHHHHPHLIMRKYSFCMVFDYHTNLEFGEAVEVPVGVHHLDAVLGHHGDLRGDCQPVLET